MLFRSWYLMRGFKNFHIWVEEKYLNYHTVFKEDIFLTFSQFRWSSVLIIIVIKQTLGLGSKLSFINQMSTNHKYAKVMIDQYWYLNFHYTKGVNHKLVHKNRKFDLGIFRCTSQNFSYVFLSNGSRRMYLHFKCQLWYI